ncbi:MAG: hypothetical protein H6622_10980 [Halobacteriovoraceae bacterium]|nr:hypothetical protein [Halobacteriovoraceae bacterium]
MELARLSKNNPKNQHKIILFDRYSNHNEVISKRPLCFFYSGCSSDLEELENYALLEKSNLFTLGIRKDLESLGFNFETFLRLAEVDKVANELIEDEVKAILCDEQANTPFSRQDELDILSDFFNT